MAWKINLMIISNFISQLIFHEYSQLNTYVQVYRRRILRRKARTNRCAYVDYWSDRWDNEFCSQVSYYSFLKDQEKFACLNNIMFRFPFVCISVGLYVNKMPNIGIVYNPITDDLFSARAGQGAYRNGFRMYTSGAKRMFVFLYVWWLQYLPLILRSTIFS